MPAVGAVGIVANSLALTDVVLATDELTSVLTEPGYLTSSRIWQGMAASMIETVSTSSILRYLTFSALSYNKIFIFNIVCNSLFVNLRLR